MDVLIAFAQVVACLFLIAIGLGIFMFILVLICIITGSSVDPDDNGLLKTKAQKEEWRKEKQAKLEGGPWT